MLMMKMILMKSPLSCAIAKLMLQSARCLRALARQVFKHLAQHLQTLGPPPIPGFVISSKF